MFLLQESSLLELPNGSFYARDVKAVKTNLTSETLNSDVKSVLKADVKVVRRSMRLSCLLFLYLTLKSSRDGLNVLDDFNVSNLKTGNFSTH